MRRSHPLLPISCSLLALVGLACAGGKQDGDPAEDTADADADRSHWDGTRRFHGSGCDDTFHETGERIPPDAALFAELAVECWECEAFFEMTPDVDRVCGTIDVHSDWIGVTFAGADSRAEVLYQNSRGVYTSVDSADATVDGATVTFRYAVDSLDMRVDVDGTLSSGS